MIGYIRANLLASALGLLAAILLGITIVQTIRIDGFRIGPIGWYGYKEKYGIAVEKLRDARAELKRISDAKNEQAKRTEGNIEKAERGNKEADDRAREIEAAPTAPDCKTPPQVMRADI